MAWTSTGVAKGPHQVWRRAPRDPCRRPVSRILSWTIIPLGDALLRRSSNLPAGFGCRRCLAARPALSSPWRTGPVRGPRRKSGGGLPAYLVLLRVGFTVPRPLLGARCALTAPFHPYPMLPARHGAVSFLLHWPSSRLDAAVPGVTRHTALRSSDFPPPLDGTEVRERQRSPSRLPHQCTPGSTSGSRCCRRPPRVLFRGGHLAHGI